jgi:hypothetical protein
MIATALRRKTPTKALIPVVFCDAAASQQQPISTVFTMQNGP